MSRGRLPDHDRVTVHLHVDPDTARDPSLLARHFRRTSLPMSEWAGCTVFLFPELERDGQPIFLDERVRAFYRQMCQQVPFLLYFLDPGAGNGTLLSVLCAFARDDLIVQRGGTVTVEPDERLSDLFAQLVADAAAYGARLGDDWRAFIDELGLPEDFRDTALRLCEPRLG
jgi:hypothetical protein